MSPPPDIGAQSYEDQDDKEDYSGLRPGFEMEEGEEAPEYDWNEYEDYDEDGEDWESCCSSEGSESLQLWPDPFDQGTEASSAPRTPSPSSLVGSSSQALDSSSVHWWQADSKHSTSLSVGLKVVCLSRPPEMRNLEVPDALRGDLQSAPSGYWQCVDEMFALEHVRCEESLPAQGLATGDFRSCPASYWAAFHQRAWPNARWRSEGEKVPPSKVVVGPKAGPRLVFSRRAHPRRPPGRQERRPGSRPTSRSLGAKAGGAARLSKEELAAASAGSSLECRAKTPCYEVTEEEFERLWLSGAVAPPMAVGEVEDVYEIPEEDFDRLLKAGQLQLAKEDDVEVIRQTLKRPRPHPEEVLVSTLPAPPVAKSMPPSTAPTPGRRHTEPTARPRSTAAESKKALTSFPLTLERSLWSEAMLPRAVGSPARLLRGLRASISGSVVPLTETEAVARSTAASSSEVDAPRRMPSGRLPRMPWEAMRKSSYSSGTDAGGDSERSSPVQTLRTLAPLDPPFPSHEDCG